MKKNKNGNSPISQRHVVNKYIRRKGHWFSHVTKNTCHFSKLSPKGTGSGGTHERKVWGRQEWKKGTKHKIKNGLEEFFIVQFINTESFILFDS